MDWYNGTKGLRNIVTEISINEKPLSRHILIQMMDLKPLITKEKQTVDCMGLYWREGTVCCKFTISSLG